jgi:mannose/fructose/N-acetylgalactosamine-specific phosphotransferase system component IIC
MWFEATLIGILCYLGALSSPWLLGLTGGWYILSRPLVSGMLVGAILGDVQTGIIIGVAVQAVYIAMVTPGGSMPADLNFVAFPAIALGILSGKGTEVAVALAATIGIMGTVLFNAMMVLNSYWNHRADLAVERGDEPITKYCLSLAITFGNFSIACCTVNNHTLVSCTAPFITDDSSGSAATSSSIATMPSQGNSFAQRVTS